MLDSPKSTTWGHTYRKSKTFKKSVQNCSYETASNVSPYLCQNVTVQYYICSKPQPEDTHDQIQNQMQALQYQIIPKTQFENAYLETTTKPKLGWYQNPFLSVMSILRFDQVFFPKLEINPKKSHTNWIFLEDMQINMKFGCLISNVQKSISYVFGDLVNLG